ncbi:hypothetical protein RHSIM_Rhsim03G0058000 [Rhododendron simsii]|uniref:D-lactate dehydrogenase (cytochrome) n=1 Tax=Rhododendron simsii TaxID=118357 RepID=A0A834LT56_RHOSS|nr:hypothetical protein RHSIM_Rhsim03G0058000 [Rhododendron simsii]
MAFSSWFSRLRFSSKPFYGNLRHSLLNRNTTQTSQTRETPIFSWASSLLLPLALAVSAGSLSHHTHTNPSLCDGDASDVNPRGLSFGGKGSKDYLVKGSHKDIPQELVNELKAICQDDMTMDFDGRYFHGKPPNSFHKAVNIPDVVVFPRSLFCKERVGSLMADSWRCKPEVPIVPYGGATSLEGHTLSPQGGVCIDMTLMKGVKSLHVEDMDVVVEAGIGWIELNEYLEPYGLFFPLDPGPGATIGGMCATRCSGSLAVRYGTMRENVINLKAVLGNGDIVKTGSRARKSAAGYDLTRLMIGSEGTLGVITEVTLRLQKIPQYSVVAMCNFPTIKDAADVAMATMLSGIQVSRVELLDEVQVKAINIANGKNLPEVPTLMFEFVGTEAYSREQTLIVQKIAAEHNGSDFIFAEDPEAKKELWRIRKEALWACFAMEPSFEAMISDVCVPLSHLAELISRSKKELDASPLVCAVVAHAGDGNFHTVILFDPSQVEHRREAERLNHFMVHTALSMEGGFSFFTSDTKPWDNFCCRLTSELPAVVVSVNYHLAPENRYPSQFDDGLDTLKFLDADEGLHLPQNVDLSRCFIAGDTAGGNIAHHYLEKEFGIEALRTMKSIKAALDPNGIMNPGKLIPPHTPLQSSGMAFSSWFSRLRSSSKPFYGNLRHSLLNRTSSPSPQITEALISDKKRKPIFSWASSLLLPLALAVSAGSLSLHTHTNPSLCDASHVDPRGLSFGGEGSGEYLVKGSHKDIPQELVNELKAICQDDMTMDFDERHFHGKPQSSFHKAVNIPDVVPIVPYGGATSIEGHTLSPQGGVCIDMTLMKRVKSLHVEDMDVVVEPGIGWIELNEYLEPYGLFFPLDPGPGATIGGMCATRCSGSLAVRYGTMRDNVINLKAVLASGDIVKTGSRARKSAAGYDLTRLMIGSEGTLGVITEVTLRLQKIPQYSVVAMCNFPTIKDAADVAIATMFSGIQVSRVELLDEVQVKAINIANGRNLPEVPTLMFEFEGTEAYSREQTLIVQKIATEHNGSNFIFAEDPEAKKELWRIRKEALWACFAMEPSSEAMISDVCVPLSNLAELISRSKKELDASPLVCIFEYANLICLGISFLVLIVYNSTVVAHAGDGNFHTFILFDPSQEEQRREADRLNHFMVHTALSMEGTCTGEHGVGTGKMKYLEKELGIEALRTMKSIKAALDPNNIMNPGKLIPPHVCF